MSYQARFEFEEGNLTSIFTQTEIAKRFDEVLKENEELISNQISAIREFLIPLLEDKELKSHISDDNVTLEFIENTKCRILWLAVNEVFNNMGFDVKQNILNLLNSNDKMKYLLKERIKVTFSSMTDWEYDAKLDKFL